VTVSTSALAALVNLVGFLIAASLSAMLLGMVWQAGRNGSRRLNRPALLAALLGLAWNFGEAAQKAAHEWAALDLGWPLAVFAFAALGFLPAMTVHTVLRPPPDLRARWRLAVLAAYGLSGAAALAHAASGTVDGEPSRPALRLLALGFLALVPVVTLAAPSARPRENLVPAAALVIFAASAWHLSVHSSAGESLSEALLGHHASLPLILAILFQGFRFALADVFLKRAVSLLLLACLALALYLGLAVPLMAASGGVLGSGVVAAVIAVWVGTALVFPWLRRTVERLVDVHVLRRPDFGAVAAALPSRLAGLDSAESALDATSRCLGEALRAHVDWRVCGEAPHEIGEGAARAVVETAEPPRFELVASAAARGRRLLSDELRLLRRAALVAARRIDALRLAEERAGRDRRELEIRRLAAEAELKALRAQLDPHFLFNALTTLGYLLRAAPERALDTLLQLTALLRAVLRRGEGDVSTLGQELDLVESYLAIERARFEKRLKVKVEAQAGLRGARVPALTLQPLVENAIKHGIAPLPQGGELRIRAFGHQGRLRISVCDTGRGASPSALAAGRRKGIGLANLERRLEMHYGHAARLTLDTRTGQGTTVVIDLPLRPSAVPALAAAVGR
jgi:signal transduction histidine kinase